MIQSASAQIEAFTSFPLSVQIFNASEGIV